MGVDRSSGSPPPRCAFPKKIVVCPLSCAYPRCQALIPVSTGDPVRAIFLALGPIHIMWSSTLPLARLTIPGLRGLGHWRTVLRYLLGHFCKTSFLPSVFLSCWCVQTGPPAQSNWNRLRSRCWFAIPVCRRSLDRAFVGLTSSSGCSRSPCNKNPHAPFSLSPFLSPSNPFASMAV